MTKLKPCNKAQMTPKVGEIWEVQTGLDEHSLVFMTDTQHGFFLDCSDQYMMLYGGPRLMLAAIFIRRIQEAENGK